MDNPHFMGLTGFSWFHGIVENRDDPLKAGRAQVRIYAWHSYSKTMQPTDQLPWAMQVLPLNVHPTTVKPPREGTMVFGYFMDGAAGQFPVMLGIVPGIPDQSTDPSHGFSDPRDGSALQGAPRPPQSVTYPEDGTGAQITETPSANRYPNFLNEPTTSRIARNENIQDTIIQSKRTNTLQNIPVATGALEVPGIDLGAVIQLPSLTIPNFTIGLNKSFNLEFCGLGINASLSAGFSFGGITLGFPTISLNGEISLGALDISQLLAGIVALGDAIAIAVDIAGCILGGTKIGNNILIDGGMLLPLLTGGKTLNLSILGIKGTVFGGISLGTIGGIPASSTPMWNEPMTPYNTNYPYNSVTETESGHVIEIDDTPGAERLHTYHRSGTFDEMHPNGDRVQKTVANAFNITYADHNTNVLGNHHTTVNLDQSNMVQGDHTETIQGNIMQLVHGGLTRTIMGTEQSTIVKDQNQTIMQNRFTDVKGDDNLIIEGNQNYTVLENCNIVIKGDCILAVAGKLTIGSTGDTELVTGGNFTQTVQGNYTVNVTGAINITGENVTVTGNPINLNQ